MAKKKLSATQKVLNQLLNGKTLTPSQIRSRYGLSNPHNPVYQLENKRGYIVVRKYTQTAKGRKTVVYSM